MSRKSDIEKFIQESRTRYMNIQLECIVSFSQMKESRNLGTDNITFLTSASRFKILLDEVKFLRRNLRRFLSEDELNRLDVIKGGIK